VYTAKGTPVCTSEGLFILAIADALYDAIGFWKNRMSNHRPCLVRRRLTPVVEASHPMCHDTLSRILGLRNANTHVLAKEDHPFNALDFQ
jgi:hypothetical protein